MEGILFDIVYKGIKIVRSQMLTTRNERAYFSNMKA
jgi:hypothetical protein